MIDSPGKRKTGEQRRSGTYQDQACIAPKTGFILRGFLVRLLNWEDVGVRLNLRWIGRSWEEAEGLKLELASG
jgi:hypothetical protein